MKFVDDILQRVPDEDLPKLRDFYKDTWCAPYIYSFFNTAMKWKAKRPDKDYIRIYAPHGDWTKDGTFVAHMEFYSYDFLVFTKEENCDKLYECLTKTKRFKYTAYRTLFYAVHRLHIDRIMDAIKDIGIPVDATNVCDVLWMPKEKAINLTVEIPQEVYLQRLSKDHIPIVNDLWPHKYENSAPFLATLLEMESAYALFLKSDDSIVSWVFKTQIASIATLETVEGHKRKGYGTVLTRFLAREIAQDGHNPIAPVLLDNIASWTMFVKLGFKVVDQITYVKVKKMG